MTTPRNIAVAIAELEPIQIDGLFERHVSPAVRDLTGSSAGGRWGPPGSYSVLYLGRPPETVIAEAYRHLVDDVDGMSGDMVGPRRLLRCEVLVSNILDLRDPRVLDGLGLDLEALGGSHAPCQRVGQAAHQLGRHGVIAPAATGLGETLALFETHLSESEHPRLLETEIWHHLPSDPRESRVEGN